MAGSFIDAYGPPTEYKVSVSNLPPGYTVQSIFYGSTDVFRDSLKLSVGDFPPGTPSSPTTLSSLPAGARGFASFTNGSGTTFAVVLPGARTAIPGTTKPPLVVTLKPPASRVAGGGGVRLRGRIPPSAVGVRRTVYASGIAGAVYADGTFEVDGLAPGLHTVISLDDPALFGGVVAIGDQDVEDLELPPISLLPAAVRIPRPPEPVGNIPSGTIVKLASIRGRVLDEITKEPIGAGGVRLYGVGQYKDYPIDAAGRFEITGVFPGSYTLEFSSGGQLILSQELTVSREDISRNFEARR